MKAIPQRALALAILVTVMTLLWGIIVYPLLRFSTSTQEHIQQSTIVLNDLHAAAGEAPALMAQLELISQQRLTDSGVIQADNAALAAAQIQNVMRTIIQGNSGRLRSANILEPSTETSYEKVGVRYDFEIPVQSLGEILYLIESRSPYLFLETIEVRGTENLDQAEAAAKTMKLQVLLTVYGYRWTDAS